LLFIIYDEAMVREVCHECIRAAQTIEIKLWIFSILLYDCGFDLDLNDRNITTGTFSVNVWADLKQLVLTHATWYLWLV